jgi:hypothetical protein
MISPLSPSYLMQGALAASTTNPQIQANHQEQDRQSQVQLPTAPPVAETQPRPQNNASSGGELNKEEHSPLEARSEKLQVPLDHSKLAQDHAPRLSQNGKTGESLVPQVVPNEIVSGAQSEVASREISTQSKGQLEAETSPNDRPSSKSSNNKVKSPYVTTDFVVAGKIINSLA